MSDQFQKYEQLVNEEDRLINKIEIYQEAISAILMLVTKQGASDLHILTIEDVVSMLHSAEVFCHTELLHLRLAKSILSNTLTQSQNPKTAR